MMRINKSVHGKRFPIIAQEDLWNVVRISMSHAAVVVFKSCQHGNLDKLGTILSAHPTTIAISTLNARQRNYNALDIANREFLT